jgi:hypothetical protein
MSGAPGSSSALASERDEAHTPQPQGRWLALVRGACAQIVR